jgi:hypothetical protein
VIPSNIADKLLRGRGFSLFKPSTALKLALFAKRGVLFAKTKSVLNSPILDANSLPSCGKQFPNCKPVGISRY